MTKRLLAPNPLLNAPLNAPPTPPPEPTQEATQNPSAGKDQGRQEEGREQWREEASLDFAGLENNIARVHFLLKSNELERERYAKEKDRIVETAQSVRENNASLHLKLQRAHQTLTLRKTYDELAEQITRNRGLKSRDEQRDIIEKFHIEIAELEQESRDYINSWAVRREQFGKMVEQGRLLLRIIRDEKEEAGRHEDLDAIDEEEAGVGSQKAEPGRTATPNPNDDHGPSSRQPESRDGMLLDPSGPRHSRALSPKPQPTAESAQGGSIDTAMADGEVSEHQQNGDDDGEVEEGEEREQMDTT